MSTILVIDDDAATRQAITTILSLRTYGTCVAPDGRTGLELCRVVRVHAALVDLFMPGLEGFATIRELRRLYPGMALIAMSGHAVTNRSRGAPDFLAMAIRLGADIALQKPFRSRELFEAIEAGLARDTDRGGVLAARSVVGVPTRSC
jgi:two-component system, response regulator, stage 0 sporulation protein F